VKGPRLRRVYSALRLALWAAVISAPAGLRAQDNYEIQVYGSETVPAGANMLELHSNFTAAGRKRAELGVLPTDRAFHETLEATHGFTPWFETGLYLFTSARWGDGWQWVGDHLRPRVRAPEEWRLPVGLSLSMEIGYQERKFSEDTWTVEIRPIIDRQWGPWYLSLNPVIEKSLRGVNSSRGFGFAPSAKASYDLTRLVTIGVEYYASLGPIGNLDRLSEEEHMVFPTLDLNFSPEWEFNLGVGVGLTHASEDFLVKVIVGRRF
jgi:hypothetical protein